MLYYIALAAFASYFIYGVVKGRLGCGKLLHDIGGEEILLSERRVFTRFNFPLIKRVTFTRVYLTRRRFVVLNWLSLGMVLQAPPGPAGSAGTEKGRFEIESRGRRKLLTLKTTLRGGGRIRFHLHDPEAWHRMIIEGK